MFGGPSALLWAAIVEHAKVVRERGKMVWRASGTDSAVTVGKDALLKATVSIGARFKNEHVHPQAGEIGSARRNSTKSDMALAWVGDQHIYTCTDLRFCQL